MGRTHPVKQSPDDPRQRDMIGHFRAYPGIFRTYSEHIMIVACERSRCRIAYHKIGRVREELGVGSRAVELVAYERSRCRIACRTVGRVRTEPVPDRVRKEPVPDRVP